MAHKRAAVQFPCTYRYDKAMVASTMMRGKHRPADPNPDKSAESYRKAKMRRYGKRFLYFLRLFGVECCWSGSYKEELWTPR